jgi:putative ABC transport system permease protein
VDPGRRVLRILPMTQVVSNTVAARRFNTLLLGIFAGLATVLTSIGLYGVISYLVAQRRHEIGIRMALGAERRDVLKLVIQQGTRLALVGVGIGLLGAWGLTRFLRTMLFGVTPSDPLTFVTVSLLLMSVALLASFIPARRAAKVDPMVALRYE